MDEKTEHILTLSDQAVALTAGPVLAELGARDERIVVLTADLKNPNRTAHFERAHPDRFFQFGVAEKNMVCAAAGMAATGRIPYVATYASFVGLLCCEQIRTAVAYPNLPVRILATHAGIAMGFDGSSHHATEDLAIMRAIANLTVVSPCDGHSLEQLIRQTVDHPGPVYFRLGRGREPRVHAPGSDIIRLGRAALLRDGSDVAIVATGIAVGFALEAAAQLAGQGVDATVIDMHTIKPIDADAIVSAAGRTGALLTVEEHNIIGGLGGAVAEVLAEAGVSCRFRRHGIRDAYSLIGPPTHLYRHYGLDGAGIATEVRALLEGASAAPACTAAATSAGTDGFRQTAVSDRTVADWLAASARTMDWLASHLHADGSWRHSADVGACFKAILAFIAHGRPIDAQRILDRVARDFLQPDGDIRNSPDMKSTDAVYEQHADTYFNYLVAVGAWRLGRLDVAIPVIDHLAGRQVDRTGGLLIQRCGADPAGQQDIFATAGGTIAMLTAGRFERARRGGAWLCDLLTRQADEPTLHTRTDAGGALVRDFPEEDQKRYQVDPSRPGQMYVLPGTAAAALVLLQQAGGGAELIDVADACLTRWCDEAIFGGSVQCCKHGWAAGLLYNATGDARWRRIVERAAASLIALQNDDGHWPFEDLSWGFRYAFNAELAYWLMEYARLVQPSGR